MSLAAPRLSMVSVRFPKRATARRYARRAYSLVELLVVLAMILIISGFAAGSLLGGSDEQEAYQVAADTSNMVIKARGRSIAQQKAYLLVLSASGSNANRGTFTMYEGNGPFSRSCRDTTWTQLEPEGGGDAGFYGGLFRDKVSANYGGSVTISSIQFANGETSETSSTPTTATGNVGLCFDPGGVYFSQGNMTAGALKLTRSALRIRFKREDEGGAIRQINIGSNGIPRMEQGIKTWAW